MFEGNSNLCQWCERPIRARRGGSPQRFCGAGCRTAFWSALRRWGERAVAAGILTVGDIKNADPAACTLVPGCVSPAPQRLGPAALRGDGGYARQEDFESLLARTIAARRR